MTKGFLTGFVLLLFPVFLHAQAVAPVTEKRASISVGGYFSMGQTDYGHVLGFSNRAKPNAYGFGGYGDFNYFLWGNLGVGVEGEVRFLNFGTPGANSNPNVGKTGSGIYEENFLGGPRMTYQFGHHFLPYAKFLIGGSRFRYPAVVGNQVYTYTTLVGGGGIDVPLNDKWTIRPVDFEYQHWDFPPNGLTPWVYSAGVSYTLF